MSAPTNPEWAVEAARDKHYQDTPVSTAALLGGLTGAAVPLALAGWDAYHKRPVDWQQVAAGSAVLGGIGAAGTSLAEMLGRTATRTLGPEFKERRWRHDQDPHRWNSALRLAPLGLLLAAKYPLLKYLAEKQSSAADLTKAEACVKENLSDKEIESGVYPKGHFRWKGLDITIETAKGQTRSGTDRNGKHWSIKLKNSYGYIKGTDSAEQGDQMDVFLGPDLDSEIVFVVDQNNTSGQFDEHKCVVGCRNSADARQLYLDNYSTGWKGFRSVTALTLEQFKAWLENGDMKSPLKGQKLGDFIKAAQGRNKKRKEKPALPDWVWAPALAGAGGAALANSFASEGAAARLQQAVNRFDSPMGAQETPLTRYVQLMSVLADSKPFGVPVGEILAKARSSETILNRFGIAPDYATKTPGAYQEARMHYDAFRKGPVAALYHMMQPKARGGTPVPQSDLFGSDLPAKDVTLNSMAMPHFQKAWDALVREKLPGASGWLSPLEVDTQVLPYDDQLKFFDLYDKSTPSVELKARRNVENNMRESLGKNTSNYLPIAKMILAARQNVKDVGTMGLSAGAGGIAGHYLGRALGLTDPGKFDWSALAGTGLGGALGYALGTEKGRNAVTRLTDRLFETR